MNRRSSFPGIIMILCALLGVMISGCGEAISDTSGPLSRVDYLKQANQICKKGGEEKDQAVREGLEEIPSQELGEASPKTTKHLTEKVIPVVENTVKELADLQPPSKDEATVQRFIAKFKAAAAKAEANPLLLGEGDPFSKAAANARSYGLKDCTL